MSKIIRSTLIVESQRIKENKKIKEDEEIKIDFFTEEDELEKAEAHVLEMKKEWEEKKQSEEKDLAHKRAEAEKFLKEAKMEAEKILEDTYDKSQEILKKARADGYDEGYERGYQEAYEKSKAESDVLIQEANEIKEAYLGAQQAFADGIEKDIVGLIAQSIETLTYERLKADSDLVLNRIKEALDPLRQAEHVTLRVSEDDLKMVEFSKDRLLAGASMIATMNIKVDGNLKTGDCIIESERGIVDASLQRQIDDIKNILQDVLGGDDHSES